MEIARLDSAPRFQCSEIDFDLPADTVIAHNGLNLFSRLDWQRSEQDPLDRRLAGGWIGFFNQHHVEGNLR